MSQINDKLHELASRYEEANFIIGDPSQFMHKVTGERHQELIAFIASSLSFGARAQFLPRIQYLLNATEGDVEGWVKEGRFAVAVPPKDECFYRLYTFRIMHRFLSALQELVMRYGNLKNFISSSTPDGDALTAIKALTTYFSAYDLQGLIPKDASSSCKRLCMFLRWMVRDSSPVDLGVWSDVIDRRTLIMPLDTHVLQEAMRIGLIHSRTTSMAAARRLTEKMRTVFPDDPLKGDFALFGFGVDETKEITKMRTSQK